VLHGDNGSTLKATTVLAMINWLGVELSYSRPRVSNDNAYVELLLRAAEYRPEFPVRCAPTPSTETAHCRTALLSTFHPSVREP